MSVPVPCLPVATFTSSWECLCRSIRPFVRHYPPPGIRKYWKTKTYSARPGKGWNEWNSSRHKARYVVSPCGLRGCILRLVLGFDRTKCHLVRGACAGVHAAVPPCWWVVFMLCGIVQSGFHHAQLRALHSVHYTSTNVVNQRTPQHAWYRCFMCCCLSSMLSNMVKKGGRNHDICSPLGNMYNDMAWHELHILMYGRRQNLIGHITMIYDVSMM
jgi:hypothetical protein